MSLEPHLFLFGMSINMIGCIMVSVSPIESLWHRVALLPWKFISTVTMSITHEKSSFFLHFDSRLTFWPWFLLCHNTFLIHLYFDKWRNYISMYMFYIIVWTHHINQTTLGAEFAFATWLCWRAWITEGLRVNQFSLCNLLLHCLFSLWQFSFGKKVSFTHLTLEENFQFLWHSSVSSSACWFWLTFMSFEALEL